MTKLKISNQELKTHGCPNCIWKAHNQCPHNISGEGTFIPKKDVDSSLSMEGICPEYIDFILSFAEEGDSVNAMWEKFSLYIARLQSLNDYNEFLKLRDEITEKRKAGEPNFKENMQNDIKLNTLRLWWERLNDTVRKGYGHIADREGRAKEGNKMAGINSAKTINFNIVNEKKEELEDKRK